MLVHGDWMRSQRPDLTLGARHEDKEEKGENNEMEGTIYTFTSCRSVFFSYLLVVVVLLAVIPFFGCFCYAH